MSVVGKELVSLAEYDPASAGRNSSSSDSEGFAGEFSKLLKMKEEEGDGIIEKGKKDAAAAGDYHNKKLDDDGGISKLFKSGRRVNKAEAFAEGGGIGIIEKKKKEKKQQQDDNNNKKKDDVDEGGDIQMHKPKGFKVDTGEKFCDLMFRLMKEVDEEDKKKKDAGDYCPNNKKDGVDDDGIILLKKGYEKLMNNKEAEEEEEEGGGGIGIIERNNKKKENVMIEEQQSAVVPIGKQQLTDLDYLLASAPTKMSRSMKKRNQAYAKEFRKVFGPHHDNFSTVNRMFLEGARARARACTSLPPN